jgi:hypothetical protein
MLDFVKIERLKRGIKGNPLLEGKWILTSNEDAVFLKEEAIYNKLKFETKKARNSDKYYSKVSGSIHYYFNEGLHNYNDFRFSDIMEVVNEISNLFSIDVENDLNNLEFGVNIKLPFEPKLILDNLVTHKGQSFSYESNNGKNYHQCKHTQFYIKIYDKSLQFGLTEKILRFEIKAIKMQYLHNNGINIHHLKCLKNKAIYEPLGKLLAKVFNEILIDCECIDTRLLSEAEKITYLKATNPNTWKRNNRLNSKGQKQLQRLLENYHKLINRHTKGTTNKLKAAKLIGEKWNELSENYHTSKESIQDNIVQYLPFKYNVSFGHKPLMHYHRPSMYSMDF